MISTDAGTEAVVTTISGSGNEEASAMLNSLSEHLISAISDAAETTLQPLMDGKSEQTATFLRAMLPSLERQSKHLQNFIMLHHLQAPKVTGSGSAIQKPDTKAVQATVNETRARLARANRDLGVLSGLSATMRARIGTLRPLVSADKTGARTVRAAHATACAVDTDLAGCAASAGAIGLGGGPRAPLSPGDEHEPLLHFGAGAVPPLAPILDGSNADEARLSELRTLRARLLG